MKRKFYLIRNRIRVLLRHFVEKMLLQFCEWRLIECHNVHFSNYSDNGEIQSAPHLVTKRYIFSISYVLRKIEVTREYWFQFKNGGRRIFIMEDYHHCEGRVSYRAELKSFYCHFSPRQRMWVESSSPVVQLFDKKGTSFLDLSKDGFSTVEVKTHHCDFSQCRYAFEFAYDLDLNKDVTPEVISQSYRAFGNQLRCKVPEINKILTGADYDGELVSPNKLPLSDNILCRHCGLPVFASPWNKYKFECLKHGELVVEEVKRVDPIEYETVMEHTLDILEDLIANYNCRNLTSGL